MHGLGNGLMDAGRELNRMGGQFMEFGRHGMDALDITWLVLGVVLWAALMTTLVMSMIALVRHLRKPKEEKPTQT